MISRHSREPEPVSPSLRRLVLAVCVFTWLIRSLYLCLPDRLSLDEDSALHAARYATASEFVNTSNWAERWDTLERVSRQGRVLWIAAHLLWGYAFPSNGGMAYGLTWISALLAMAALAGAARQLFGERGFLLCLLLASLSPLFLNFTVRALGAMPSVACFCAALWLLSAPSWTLPRWVAGGLCLGVAFAIHYGTGVAIVALAAGLCGTVVRRLADRQLPARRRFWEGAVCPFFGALAAVAPLLALELWARYAGSSFVYGLVHQTNLGFSEVGPYGLWLRELFELDPLLQVAAGVGLFFAVRDNTRPRWQQGLFGLAAVCAVTLVAPSLPGAAPRALVSLGLGVVAAAMVCSGALLLGGRPTPPAAEPGTATAASAKGPAPFDGRALALSLVVATVVFTCWRQVSSMPRHVFPAWTLAVLGLVALLLRSWPHRFAALVRGMVGLGALLFAIGVWATYQAKTVRARADAYARQHPYLQELAYEDFWTGWGAAARLSRRARYDLVIIGPSTRLYPASVYEEEPYKIAWLREMVKTFSLTAVLTAEQIPEARIFFEEAQPRGDRRPPPGTPEIAEVVRAVDGNDRVIRVLRHPYRGLELRLPAGRWQRPITIAATLALPAAPRPDSRFGCEVEALAPNVPDGTRLTLSAFQGAQPLAATPEAIRIVEGLQADRSGRVDEFRLLEWPISPVSTRVEIRLMAELSVPAGAYCPPVSLYVRRPYINHG